MSGARTPDLVCLGPGAATLAAALLLSPSPGPALRSLLRAAGRLPDAAAIWGGGLLGWLPRPWIGTAELTPPLAE